MEILLRPAQETDIEKIKYYITQFFLDEENLDYSQFYIAEFNGEIAGFCRIKCYGEVYEMATLGVIEKFRGAGIGKKLVQSLLTTAPSREIWITTIIPAFFEPLGFEKSDNPPVEILNKCERICKKLHKTTKNSCFMCYKKTVFT
jgi:N-acetylglutamate synthase-like GNAT family acetyltransferase